MTRLETSPQRRLRSCLCRGFDIKDIAINTKDSGIRDAEGLISLEAIPYSLMYADLRPFEFGGKGRCMAEWIGASIRRRA